MSPKAIEISGVSVSFGKIKALESVDLIVRPGEFVSLIGPSGCGKTTLLRIIAGLEAPTCGRVRVLGDSPLRACKEHQIGVAFQRPALLASRTALQNVQLTLTITGERDILSPKQLLADFGLSDFMNSYPHQLSGGMQQRVNIAAAMVHNPEILLLDEPFGSLDEITRGQMGDWLTRVLEGMGQTIVFVTHSVDEAVLLSDRVVLLSPRPGKVIGDSEINLPQPRSRSMRASERFVREVVEIRASLNELADGGDD